MNYGIVVSILIYVAPFVGAAIIYVMSGSVLAAGLAIPAIFIHLIAIIAAAGGRR